MSVSTFSGLAGYTGVARSTSVSPFSSVVANTGLPTTKLGRSSGGGVVKGLI